MSCLDSIINGYKDISLKLITEENITDSKEAYEKIKNYFVDDECFNRMFEYCFNSVLCQYEITIELDKI
jgi:hypothetical protein